MNKPTNDDQELTLTKPLAMPTIKPITTELAQVPKDYLLTKEELIARAKASKDGGKDE
jgi:hypothetical protein